MDRRAFLYEKQEGKCCWCRRTMHIGAHGKSGATIEHLIPVAKRKKRKDGRAAAYRLLACFKCNTGRKCEIAPEEMLRTAAILHRQWLKTQPENVWMQKEHAMALLIDVSATAPADGDKA